MAYAVQNNVDAYNALTPTTGNIEFNNPEIAGNQIDFESVSLHEIGHCLGMAHINAATESGLTGNNQNYTKATDGENNVFDLNAGVDGVIGSSDDIRGDDVNLTWFRTSNNDPFTIASVVDSTTYSRDLADLPNGHMFAANADRSVSTLLGYPYTEAVMQQGTYFGELQRTLGHDDVATLRYAASGINERESGAPDNYTIVLEYGGISTSDCDISLSITNTVGLAFCAVSGSYIGSGNGNLHLSITSANIEFGSGYNWHFSSSDPDSDGDGYPDSSDNCPNVANPSQNNNDGDSQGDACDDDDDNDGLSDNDENTIFFTNPFLADSDGDSLSDFQEVNSTSTDPNLADTDDDGLDDGVEISTWSTDPLNSNLGDVGPFDNPDNQWNAADLIVMTRLVTGTLTLIPGSLQDILGDMNDDDKVDVADLLLLQQLILNSP